MHGDKRYQAMNTAQAYGWLAVSLFAIEQLYIGIARHYHLFEARTERSLHTEKTAVRGGGILFFVSALIASYMDSADRIYFLVGLTVVACISFLDDLYHVPKRYRLLAHSIAISLLALQTELFSNPSWILVGSIVLGIGVLNMHNFMDGINGMTAFYGLVTIGSLLGCELLNEVDHPSALLPSVWIALVIFGVYNARRQAICFAGDVGSITLGFITVYALLRVINQNHTYLPLLLLAVYGVDTTLTLGYRLRNRQNIFQAHQLHLFQLLVHRKKYNHLAVAGAYATLQALINGMVYVAMDWQLRAQIGLAALVISGLSIGYVVVRKPLVPKKGQLRELTFFRQMEPPQ